MTPIIFHVLAFVLWVMLWVFACAAGAAYSDGKSETAGIAVIISICLGIVAFALQVMA